MPLPSDHNVTNVRHAIVRQDSRTDEWYREAHDRLTQCYREGKPYSEGGQDFGVLDEATFNALHNLTWQCYLTRFAWVNENAIAEKDRVPTDEYDAYAVDGVDDPEADPSTWHGSRIDEAETKIASTKTDLQNAGKDVPTGWDTSTLSVSG